jgi:hypothetical protein
MAPPLPRRRSSRQRATRTSGRACTAVQSAGTTFKSRCFPNWAM